MEPMSPMTAQTPSKLGGIRDVHYKADANLDQWTYSRLLSHIAQRGFHWGALAGAIVSPALMQQKAGNFQFDTDVLTSTAGQAALIGLAFTSTAGAVQSIMEEKTETQTKLFRLYLDDGEKRCNTFAQVGAAAGLAAAGYRERTSGLQLVGHAAVGAAAGFLTHKATWSADTWTK